MTAYPTVTTEVSWTTDPDDTPVWVDIDATRHAVKDIATTRGRAYEQDQPQAGTLSATLDDSSGDFTPDNTAGAYYPNVDTDKAIRVRVTEPFAGGVYPLFYGTLTEIPVDPDTAGFDNPSVALAAVDDFQNLNLTTLRSAFDEEVLKAGPYAYFPMSDDAAAGGAGDIGPNAYAPGHLTYRGQPGGSSKFGGVPQLTADDGTSLELAPAQHTVYYPATLGGSQLVLPLGAALPPKGYSISLKMSVDVTLLTGGVIPIEQWGADGSVQFRMVFGTSSIDFFTGNSDPAGGGSNFCGNFDPSLMADGLPHTIVATVSANGLRMRIYADGVQIATATNTYPCANAYATAGFQVGSADRPSGTAGSWFGGRMSKLALFSRELTAAEVSQMYAAESGFDGETTGARISRLLDYAHFPAARRALDTGESMCGPLISKGQDTLTLLTNVARTESGVIFVAPDGDFTFLGRARTRNTVSRVTLGTLTLPVEADGMRFDHDNSLVRNVINATRPNGPTIMVKDDTSIRKHRRRVKTVTYEVSTDYEMYCAASWDLYLYAFPRTRMSSIVLDPFTAPALWPWALGLEVGDRITLTNLPLGAPAATLDFIVQNIAHTANAVGKWLTTLLLSPPVPPSLRGDASPSALTALNAGLVIPY